MLSLIVPCYNEEGNVKKFFDETNKAFAGRVDDYEFVFVNDGSRDSSKDICDEYATRDPRVKVIHKPNEGVAATRMPRGQK